MRFENHARNHVMMDHDQYNQQYPAGEPVESRDEAMSPDELDEIGGGLLQVGFLFTLIRSFE